MPIHPNPIKVVLIGPGQIGIDLLYKISRSALLECVLVIGKDINGQGIKHAEQMGFKTKAGGIDALIDSNEVYQLAFDATDASFHKHHWDVLNKLGKRVIDLTPSGIGHMIVPTEFSAADMNSKNFNLISCGGQAAIPILADLSREFNTIEYTELITTASSPSVGRATRLNIDEYIYTTEAAIKAFTQIPNVKVMLNISAAFPIAFRVILHVKGIDIDFEKAKTIVLGSVRKVNEYVPGYRLLTLEKLEEDHIYISVEVNGQEDFLPKYAGNLDIINSAAIFTAEKIACLNPDL